MSDTQDTKPVEKTTEQTTEQTTEKSTEQTKPNRGGRGRGRGRGREGRGGKPNGKDTRKDGKPRRGGPKDAPKDSFYYKYHFGERPQIEKVDVTLETEVPAEIPKADILPEPTRDEHIKTLEAVDAKIEAKKVEITKINQKKKDIFKKKDDKKEKELKEAAEEGKEAPKEKTFKDILAEKREVQAQLKDFQENSDKWEKELQEIATEENFITKNSNSKFKTGAAVNKKIAEIEKKMTTTSISAADERECHKEITFLKKSLEFVARMDDLLPRKDELHDEIKSVKPYIRKLRKQIYEYNQKLDTMNEEFKASNKLRDENSQVLDKLEETVQTIKKVIGELYQEKSDLKEAFFKAKYEFELQQQIVRHRDFIIRRQTRLQDDVKYEKEREEKRLAERAAIPNPFEDEIENCTFLAGYLKKLKRDREAKEIK